MQLPSTDVFIGLIFLVGIVYGFLFQREKIITTLCSVYIGLVIASTFSQTVFDFFNGNKVVANQIWIRSNASTSTIAIIILLLSIVMISGAVKSDNKKGDVSGFEIIIYSTLSIALILTSILGFLPAELRDHYIATSKVAGYLYMLKTWIVVIPPIMLVILNWKKKSN